MSKSTETQKDTQDAAFRVQTVLDSGVLLRIIELCKVPSLVYYVLHEGKFIAGGGVGFGKNGHRNEAPDERSLFTVCSLSKTLVAACVGILVDEGKLDWDDPVSKYVPQYAPRDDQTPGRQVSNASICEVLRQSSGLSNPTVSFVGPHGKAMVPKEDFIHVLNDTSTEHKGEAIYNRWCYSNVGYALMTLVIEAATNSSYDRVLKERILEPLRMNDTAVTESEVANSKNLAQSYVQLEDGSFKAIGHDWTSEKNTPMLGMISVRSSAKDMAILMCALMQALHEHTSAEQKEVLGIQEHAPDFFELLKGINNPLKQVDEILLEKYWWLPCSDGYDHKHVHHLPWHRTKIPCANLSWTSWNMTMSGNVSEAERPIRDGKILGQSLGGPDSKPITAYTFGGTGFCGNGAARFVPQSRTAIVVFSGGLNVGDASELANLALLQAVLGLTPEVDIVEQIVKPEVKARELQWKNMWKEIKNHEDEAPPRFDLSECTGVYSGLGIQLAIHEADTKSGLSVCFNGKNALQFPLKVYQKDMLSYWPENHDEWLTGGWLDWDHWEIGVFKFFRNTEGSITGLTWVWEKSWEPAVFNKSVAGSQIPTSDSIPLNTLDVVRAPRNGHGPDHSIRPTTSDANPSQEVAVKEDFVSESSTGKTSHASPVLDKEKQYTKHTAEDDGAVRANTWSFRKLWKFLCRPF